MIKNDISDSNLCFIRALAALPEDEEYEYRDRCGLEKSAVARMAGM